MSEWGNPAELILSHPKLKEIGSGREPGELKHLSNPRKRENSASSGERKWNSPNRRAKFGGVEGAGDE
jgi:hypothetical protein